MIVFQLNSIIDSPILSYRYVRDFIYSFLFLYFREMNHNIVASTLYHIAFSHNLLDFDKISLSKYIGSF